MIGMMIAGTSSGVGKTTVTLAIMAAMRQRGLAVQPFKGGPDFLDTGHHTRIAGRASRNLDTWMLSHEANRELFVKAARGADAVIAEGMMGLFDGKDGMSETGSSAEIAKLLMLPVVLVLDAGKSARSIAAVVLGFEMFDPALQLAGVVLNRVGSERHYRMLQAAITAACRTPVLGWLPKEPAIAIPERHLGLHMAEESWRSIDEELAKLAMLAEEHLDFNRLWTLRCALSIARPDVVPLRSEQVRIGVARDHAFSFYYEDNLDLLRESGAELVPFSPLDDRELPADLDALYLGGGYPELHAARLSSNVAMKSAIAEFAASQRPVYAECGGMMYLAQSLWVDGTEYAMCGVLPCSFAMTAKLVKFGYVTATFTCDCLLGPRGTVVRGHSFHHSRMIGDVVMDRCYALQYSLSGLEEQEGFVAGNTLASYLHLHFRACPSVAKHFVAAAREQRSARLVSA